jgi:hypothetical protein
VTPPLGSIPAPIAGCPTSRSFFARCGIPQAFPSSLLRSPQLRTGAPCSHQRCPDFLLRSTSHDRVCGFLSKKAAWSCSTPPRSTGNPGYVGRKRWAKPTKAFRTELYASFLSAGTERNGGLRFSSPGTHTPSKARRFLNRSWPRLLKSGPDTKQSFSRAPELVPETKLSSRSGLKALNLSSGPKVRCWHKTLPG